MRGVDAYRHELAYGNREASWSTSGLLLSNSFYCKALSEIQGRCSRLGTVSRVEISSFVSAFRAAGVDISPLRGYARSPTGDRQNTDDECSGHGVRSPREAHSRLHNSRLEHVRPKTRTR
jgi:hypothetical protein